MVYSINSQKILWHTVANRIYNISIEYLLKSVYDEAKVLLISAKLSYSNQLAIIRQVLGYALAGAEALLNLTSGSAPSIQC